MRNTFMGTTHGYTPMFPISFASSYRGPVFQAEGGGGGGASDDAVAVAAAAAAQAETDRAALVAAEAAAAALRQGKPSDNEARLLREVMENKRLLAAATAEANSLKTKFEGIDPAKVRAAQAAADQAEKDALLTAGNFDALKARMAAEHQAELARERAKIAEAEASVGKLNTQIRELTVGSAFLGSKFLVEDTVLPTDIARVAFDTHFEVEDGKVVGYDSPRGAAGRGPLVNGSGQPMSFDDAMKRIVDASPNRDRVLRSKATSGPGTSTTHTSTPTNPNLQPQNNGANGATDGIATLQRGLAAMMAKKK